LEKGIRQMAFIYLAKDKIVLTNDVNVGLCPRAPINPSING
jgi:hypothetical protein